MLGYIIHMFDYIKHTKKYLRKRIKHIVVVFTMTLITCLIIGSLHSHNINMSIIEACLVAQAVQLKLVSSIINLELISHIINTEIMVSIIVINLIFHITK